MKKHLNVRRSSDCFLYIKSEILIFRGAMHIRKLKGVK